MKFKHLLITSAIFGALNISGCSSDDPADDGISPPPATTTTAFTVNVQVPDGLSATTVASAPASFFDGLFISDAMAATVSSNLGAGNFKVAIVNSAGVVTEIVTPQSISQETDGSWIVILEGGRRVDCVIIADVSKTPDVTIGQTLPADAIYAPTASEQFDIDIRSTSAYQEFIAAVEDTLDLTAASGFTEDDVTALVTAAQQLPLPTYTVGQTLEQYLEVAIPELEALVEREVVVITSTDTTFSLATYLENGGGINWYWSEGTQYDRGTISYDASTQTSTETEETFDGISWNPITGSSIDGLILTATGWTPRVDQVEFDSLNADGSVTLRDISAPAYQETVSAVEVDVAGQPIELFLPEFGDKLANTATFSAGATALLINFSFPVDIYEVWADDFSGTATAFERYNGSYSVITTLDEMFSATASTSTDPDQMNLVRNEPLALELIGSPTDTTGTVNIITIDTGTFPNVATVIDTSTWERRTVNGQDMVLIAATGNALQDEEGDAGFYMLTVYPDNYSGTPAVVEGWFSPAGTVGEDGDFTFNDIAAQDINDSFDPSLLACDFSSTWGVNEPLPFNSYDDFLQVLAECGGAQPLAAADLEGNTYAETWDDAGVTVVEAITYNVGGTFSFSETRDAIEVKSDTGLWSINNNLLTLSNQAVDFIDVIAAIGVNQQLAYTEEASWSSNPDLTVSNASVAEGEIWHGSATPQVSTTTPPPAALLTCSFETLWDDTNNQPAAFNSFTDFEAVLADCGSLVVQPITSVEVIGTWGDLYTDVDGDWIETMVYNQDGTGTYTETLNGNVTDTVPFNWTITNNLIEISVANIHKEFIAPLSDGTQKVYSEDADWTPAADLIPDGNADGEIWTGNYLKQL